MALRLILGLWALCALCLPTAAFAFETRASGAYVLDQTTGTVLLSKNAQTPLPPASMSKLMTLYMTFEALRDGRLRWDETLGVSRHAMSYGGSTMFLDTTDRVSVEDLVKGIIVLSGNDACAVLAEALSIDGTEAGFANMMTQRAQELGMMNSTFGNSNGWPHPRQRMSMEDLGIIASILIRDFPGYYALFAQQEFAFDGRAPANTQNRNPLLGLGLGADGLKTGHTSEAGYGLVGSAKKGDRRIVFVISGMDTALARSEESQRIVNWAFRQFAARSLGDPGTVLAQADVWMGASRSVGLTMEGDPQILVPTIGQDKMTTFLEYTGPIEAPITAGDQIAELVIAAPGLPESRLPLVAAHDVARGGFVPRVRTAAKLLIGQIAGAVDGAL